MNVAIVEYNNIHLVYINALIHIFNSEKNDITMFVSAEIEKAMIIYLKNDYEKIKWVIYQEKFHEGLFKKLNLIFYIIKLKCQFRKYKFDKIVFCSPETYSFYLLPFFILLKNQGEVIVSIHNLNRVFRKSKNIKEKCFKYIFNKSDSIAVLERGLKKYVLENKLISKKIYVFPFDFCRSTNRSHLENKISFVIPGNIQEERKDYRFIIEVFEEILNNYDVEFVILGYGNTDYAKSVLIWAEKMRQQGKNVVSYKSFVSIEEYEKRLKDATVLINPIKVSIKGEIYGVCLLYTSRCV